MADGEISLTGSILIYNLFDVAWEIDLSSVEAKVGESKRLSIERRRFSRAFEFQNPPVSIRLSTFDRILMGRTFPVNTFLKAYDFGVFTVIVEIPLRSADLKSFEDLAQFIMREDPFRDDFVREVKRAMRDLESAMTQPKMSRFEEDYTIYYISNLNPAMNSRDFLDGFDYGSLLLHDGSDTPPGDRIKKELLSHAFSYADDDLVIVNWDNALVIEPTGSMDIPDLLEFANAQLLELRFYDDMLDRELDTIYEQTSRRGSPSIWKIKQYERLAARVMRTVADLTGITEKIDNSLKVTNDVYYARIYSSALSLFRVKQWESNIKRKIDIASRVYDMIYREIATKRTELLELIIVLLIAVEIALFLLGWPK